MKEMSGEIQYLDLKKIFLKLISEKSSLLGEGGLIVHLKMEIFGDG